MPSLICILALLQSTCLYAARGKTSVVPHCIENVLEDPTGGIMAKPSPPIDLFGPAGNYVSNYTHLVDSLRPGSRIRLPSGRIYVVHAILDGNRSSLNRVLDIGDGWALKIPLQASEKATASMYQFYHLQPELKAAGVPVVEMDPVRSEPPFGIVVKKENFLFEGDQFIHLLEHPDKSPVSPGKLKDAREALLRFLDSTWAYARIGDLTPNQLGYDGHDWVLFDVSSLWNPQHLPLRNFDQKETVFSPLKAADDTGEIYKVALVPKELRKESEKRILAIRKRMKSEGKWFERSGTVARGFELIDRVTPRPLPKGWKKIFKTNEHWNVRFFTGYVPKADRLKIEIRSFETRKDGIETYQAVVNGKYPVKLNVLVKSKKAAEQELETLRRKLRREDAPYFAGDDFILIYGDPRPDPLQRT